MTTTPLDAVGDGAPFYNLFAGVELFLLLQDEAVGDQISPDIFETEEGVFVLGFDREHRLTEFAGGPAPYAAMTGRQLAAMLAGQGIGVALNPDAPSARLLPANAIDWLHNQLSTDVEEVGAKPTELFPPKLPETVIQNLDIKLASAAGLARCAYLVAANYDTGAAHHLLAFVDALPGAQAPLTQAVNEALTFADIDAGQMDVAFFDVSDPMAARLAKVGLRFDLPEPSERSSPAVPGGDPDRPPRLR